MVSDVSRKALLVAVQMVKEFIKGHYGLHKKLPPVSVIKHIKQ